MDRSWWERGGGEGEAATPRTAKGVLGAPSGRVLGSEVGLKRELQLDDGGGGVLDDEGAGEVGDGVSEGGGNGGRHFEED